MEKEPATNITLELCGRQKEKKEMNVEKKCYTSTKVRVAVKKIGASSENIGKLKL